MRALWITLPGSVLVATAGIVLANLPPSAAVSSELPATAGTRHTVSPDMQRAANSLRRHPLPKFQEKTASDDLVTEQDMSQGRPTLILFVKNECPCSIEFQPIVNRLAAAYGPDVRFYGVMDADQRDTDAFATLCNVAYPMICDTDRSLIKAFKVKASAAIALVDGEGNIAKVWPGYDKATLRQVNLLLGTLAKTGPREFDDSSAPEELTSGCSYEL